MISSSISDGDRGRKNRHSLYFAPSPFIILAMKRILSFVLVMLLAFSLSAALTVRDDLFSSSEELAAFETEAVSGSEEEYYENMKIYLLTGGEGSAVWENFGHSAFVVEREGYDAVGFDYGIFTFDSTFLPNFILGKLYYQVWETYARYRILSLIGDDRTVSMLELDLTKDGKKALWSFLLYNTEEENRTYLYDYFRDNCATRLRDMYSWATGGDFEEWLRSQKSTETIRYSVNRHLSRSTFFVCWVINYMLGKSVDEETTRWEECYLPGNLEKAIEEYQQTESEIVYETEERKPTPEKWSLTLRSLLFGVALALLSLAASLTKYHHVPDAVLGVVFSIFGIMSLVLIFFEFFTIHYVTHDNLNILILTPLCLVSAVLHFMSIGKRRRERKISLLSLVMLGLLAVVIVLKLILPSFFIQDIWAPALPALLLYSAEALVYLLKKRK